jgi:hypothetical protein
MLDKVDPPHGWSQLAVIEFAYVGVMGEQGDKRWPAKSRRRTGGILSPTNNQGRVLGPFQRDCFNRKSRKVRPPLSCLPVAGWQAATLIHNAVLPRAATAARYVSMMIADVQ